MKRIAAVIPIKLNNERLPGKNIMLLNGRPLIYYIQKNLLSEARINERYVFCSDDRIKDYLLNGFAFLRRPVYLDAPTSNFTQIFEEFMKKIDADIYIYAHATAPFINNTTMELCLDEVLSGKYDSAFCAVKIQDFLWKDGKPLNFDPTNLPRSQDLPVVYRETSGIYVFTKESFLKTHSRIGMKPYIREVSFKEAIDINTSADFALAEQFFNINL